MTDKLDDTIVVVAAKRTALGNLMGALSGLSAPEMAGFVIADIIRESGIEPSVVDEVVMGNVLSAGQGQAPARQATILAGLPNHVAATTINKMCGSGLKSIMMACDQMKANHKLNVMIAGGMESMSQAPHLIKGVRSGQKMGHTKIYDHMMLDGLEDAYDKGKAMGAFAEECASAFSISRSDQDEYALESLSRAVASDFSNEITPISVILNKSTIDFKLDEAPLMAQPDRILSLRPAFIPNGTITAANASSISDGAAAVMLMKKSHAQKNDFPILCEIKGYNSFAHAPEWFSTAPISSIRQLLGDLEWSVDDVDLFEINEAFAVVTMAAMKELKISHDKVNIKGGACALGHPIGASGARILVTLIHALREKNLNRGVASLCIGGGEAVSMAIEVNNEY
jgi:acetyl-CoA C-acetyltransferase